MRDAFKNWCIQAEPKYLDSSKHYIQEFTRFISKFGSANSISSAFCQFVSAWVAVLTQIPPTPCSQWCFLAFSQIHMLTAYDAYVCLPGPENTSEFISLGPSLLWQPQKRSEKTRRWRMNGPAVSLQRRSNMIRLSDLDHSFFSSHPNFGKSTQWTPNTSPFFPYLTWNHHDGAQTPSSLPRQYSFWAGRHAPGTMKLEETHRILMDIV